MEQFERRLWEAAVGDALRAERGVAGLSQAEVERKTGITRSSYRLYEAGQRQPDLVQLALIAEAFGIPVSRLLSEVERRAHEMLNAPQQPDAYTLAALRSDRPTDRELFDAAHPDDHTA